MSQVAPPLEPTVVTCCPVCDGAEFLPVCDESELTAESALLQAFHRRRLGHSGRGELEERASFTQDYQTALVSCAACGLLLRLPRPNSRDLRGAYASDEYALERLPEMIASQVALFRTKIPVLAGLLDRSPAVLEVGSFLGGFLEALPRARMGRPRHRSRPAGSRELSRARSQRIPGHARRRSCGGRPRARGLRGDLEYLRAAPPPAAGRCGRRARGSGRRDPRRARPARALLHGSPRTPSRQRAMVARALGTVARLEQPAGVPVSAWPHHPHPRCPHRALRVRACVGARRRARPPLWSRNRALGSGRGEVGQVAAACRNRGGNALGKRADGVCTLARRVLPAGSKSPRDSDRYGVTVVRFSSVVVVGLAGSPLTDFFTTTFDATRPSALWV